MKQNKEIFYKMIMDKIIKQYLKAVSKISIQKMAETLNIQQEMLVEVLKELIKSKEILFLIDPINQVFLIY